MSTRSYIGFYDGEINVVECIYCHHDGYLTHNGVILNEHYKEAEKVKQLIEKGGCSSLGTKICNTDFYNTPNDKAMMTSLRSFVNNDEAYYYLFNAKTSEWNVFHKNDFNRCITAKLSDALNDYDTFYELGGFGFIDPRKEFSSIPSIKEAYGNNYQSWEEKRTGSSLGHYLRSIINKEDMCVEVGYTDYGRDKDIYIQIPISSFEEGEKISDNIYGKLFEDIKVEYGLSHNVFLEAMHAVSDEEIYGDILIDNDPYFYEYNSVNKEVCIYNYNEMGNVEGVAHFEDEALVKQVCELIETQAIYYIEHSYDGITHFEKDGVDYSVALKAPYIIISSSEPEFEIDGNEVQEKEFKFSSDIEALSIYNHIADSHFIGHTEQEFIDENDIAVDFDDDVLTPTELAKEIDCEFVGDMDFADDYQCSGFLVPNEALLARINPILKQAISPKEYENYETACKENDFPIFAVLYNYETSETTFVAYVDFDDENGVRVYKDFDLPLTETEKEILTCALDEYCEQEYGVSIEELAKEYSYNNEHPVPENDER